MSDVDFDFWSWGMEKYERAVAEFDGPDFRQSDRQTFSSRTSHKGATPWWTPVILDEDEKRLAELGYKQELNRSWSGFSNFAISFSIISILAGCFTTFGVGWNNGGPAAIAWGWPIVAALILVIGLCMSELVSAFPTSGGIYWWASKLGGAKAGYYTGWLNLIGLLAIVASVAYGCATFFDLTLGHLQHVLGRRLQPDPRVHRSSWSCSSLAALVNIFSSHLLAILNNISVWWHVAGATAVVLILLFAPSAPRERCRQCSPTPSTTPASSAAGRPVSASGSASSRCR